MFPSAAGPLRLIPGSRDVGVDSLAAELVIDGRLAHGATPYGRVCADGIHIMGTSGVDCVWAVEML
ncbi:MAG: hypothetical protein ACRDTH_14135 [Pseudonocardiaceae bacterium]